MKAATASRTTPSGSLPGHGDEARLLAAGPDRLGLDHARPCLGLFGGVLGGWGLRTRCYRPYGRFAPSG